ncbi:hypothetical protein ACHAWF_006629 [Thalassiosira exigua]
MASSAASEPPTYHHAISLEINTLSLLLRRNYHQHRRCIYFRRLSMVLSALCRLPSFEEMNQWLERWKRLVILLLDECADDKNPKSRNRRRQEEHWTLEKDGDRTVVKTESESNPQLQELRQLPNLLEKVMALVSSSLPQLISRIIHATSPVLHEISRAYFVPFFTIALACLGRIHALLLRMGREVATVLRETVSQLRQLCDGKSAKANDSIIDWKQLRDLVTPNNQSTKPGAGETQEWDDLMARFVEASHDDLTGQINAFVKEQRAKALSRFGVPESISDSITSNLLGNQPSDIPDHSMAANESDGPSSSDAKRVTQPSIEKDERQRETTDDAGELVERLHSKCDDATQRKLSPSDHSMDDNMKRIMQRDKLHTAAPSKKRKKKKKKEKALDLALETSKDDEGQLQHHVDEADNIDNELVSEGGMAEESGKPSDNDALQLKTTPGFSPSEGAALERTNDDPYSAKQKKTKRKSSKKAKKQKRKSSSVIDDIFG